MGFWAAVAGVNIGSGQEVSIRELAQIVCDVVGYPGDLVFDASRPDGTPRKLLDCVRLSQLGWEAETELRVGIALAYEDFLRQRSG